MQKDHHLTLEDISAATGMTARNVRAYQTKGLIPPPTRRGRRSVYGEEHLLRLQAIERARAAGASLSLIASHLAAGRSLEEDSLIDARAGSAPLPPGRAEIGSLLATVDPQQDPSARAQVDELIAAGVFRKEGRQVYAGRDLADALTALHQQGLPVRAALGVAGRAVTAAVPIAESVRASLADLDGAAATVVDHLGTIAGYVVRHVVVEGLPR